MSLKALLVVVAMFYLIYIIYTYSQNGGMIPEDFLLCIIPLELLLLFLSNQMQWEVFQDAHKYVKHVTNFSFVAIFVLSIFSMNIPRQNIEEMMDIWVDYGNPFMGEMRRVRNGGIINDLLMFHQDQDMENVHDHNIQSILVEQTDKLIQDQSPAAVLSTTAWILDLKAFINSPECDVNKKRHAMETLETIEKTNQYMVNIQMNELDHLRMIYNAVQSRSNRLDLMNNLVLQLADARDIHGETMCATGRVTRIAQVLEPFKPTLTDEQLAVIFPNLVIKYKDALLKHAGPGWQKVYDTHQESSPYLVRLQKQLRSKIKKNISKHLHGRVSSRKINRICQEWLEHV